MPSIVTYTAYLEGSITLDRHGVWHHERKPIANERICTLFHRSIVWDEEQRQYFLEVGPERATFRYEDTVYFVNDIFVESGRLMVSLHSGGEQALDPAILECGPDHALYARVHGHHPARFLRGAHQRLIDTAVSPELCIFDSIRVELRPRETP